MEKKNLEQKKEDSVTSWFSKTVNKINAYLQREEQYQRSREQKKEISKLSRDEEILFRKLDMSEHYVNQFKNSLQTQIKFAKFFSNEKMIFQILKKLCGSPKYQEKLLEEEIEIIEEPTELEFEASDFLKSSNNEKKEKKDIIEEIFVTSEEDDFLKIDFKEENKEQKKENDFVMVELPKKKNIKKKVLKKVLNEKIMIRFVISDGSVGRFERLTFKAASMIGLVGKFGAMHTFVSIGNCKIEINNTGICVPRKFSTRNALLCADIYEIKYQDDLEEKIQIISKFIATKNTSEQFSQLRNNCQDFSRDLLNSLGLLHKLEEFPSTLKQFISKIRNNYMRSMELEFDKEFCTKFSCDSKIEFKTHEQLDKFVRNCISIDKEFLSKKKYKGDVFVLKSIDRAFWLHERKRIQLLTLEKKIHLYSEPEYLKNCPWGSI